MEKLIEEVKFMKEYLCLTELLDQDLSAYEFFQTLAPVLQDQLKQDGDIRSFTELQARAAEGSKEASRGMIPWEAVLKAVGKMSHLDRYPVSKRFCF